MSEQTKAAEMDASRAIRAYLYDMYSIHADDITLRKLVRPALESLTSRAPREEPGRRDDTARLDWLTQQAQPHHGVILCVLDLPAEKRGALDLAAEKWASVQRVDQFHNPHKVEWCHEGATIREAIDKARDA